MRRPVAKAVRAADRGRSALADAREAAALWVSPSRRQALVNASRECRSPADLYRFAAEHIGRGPTQIESEILAFVDRARAIAPERICEIGTEYGGTNFLLTHTLPTVRHVVGIDLWVRNKAHLRVLGRPGLRQDFLDGSSLKPARIRRVERLLGGRQLDILFIDGDHSFDGVRDDFLSYRHLVRDGGLVAFHDIVSDGGSTAAPGGAYAGDVPLFWSLVRRLYPAEELVERRDQHGFGIGVIEYHAATALPPDALARPPGA